MRLYKTKKVSSRFAQIALVSVALLAANACSSFSDKFTPQDRVDLSPFAEHTITMVGQLDYGFARDRTVLTSGYFDENSDELKKLVQLQEHIERLLRSIVSYSIEIVRVSKQNISEPEKAKLLALYLDELAKNIENQKLVSPEITMEEVKELFEEVGSQEEFLDAVKATQPLVNEVVRYGMEILEDIKLSQQNIAQDVTDSILTEYKEVIAFSEALAQRKDNILQALTLLFEYQRGNTNVLTELKNNSFIKSRRLIPLNSLTIPEALLVEDELNRELQVLNDYYESIEFDVDYFEKTLAELQTIIDYHDEEIHQAWAVIFAWSRAHERMASGVTDPAQWFDITDPSGELFEITKKVIMKNI